MVSSHYPWFWQMMQLKRTLESPQTNHPKSMTRVRAGASSPSWACSYLQTQTLVLLQCAQDNTEALTGYCQSGRKEAVLSRVKGESMSTCRSTAEPLRTCTQCSPEQGVHQCPETKRWPEDLWRLTSMPSLKGHFYVIILLFTRETSKEVASGPGATCSLSWASLYSLKAELWFFIWVFLWRVFSTCRLRKAIKHL